MKLPAISHHTPRRAWESLAHHVFKLPSLLGQTDVWDSKLLQKQLYTEGVLLPAVGWWGSCMDIKEGSGGAQCPVEALAVNGNVRFITSAPSLWPQGWNKSSVVRVRLACGVSVQTASSNSAARVVTYVNNRVAPMLLSFHDISRNTMTMS